MEERGRNRKREDGKIQSFYPLTADINIPVLAEQKLGARFVMDSKAKRIRFGCNINIHRKGTDTPVPKHTHLHRLRSGCKALMPNRSNVLYVIYGIYFI